MENQNKMNEYKQNNNYELNENKEYNKYFGKNEILEYRFNYPCKKSSLITELRKIGDIKNQYVTNVYYLDTIENDIDGDLYQIDDGVIEKIYTAYCHDSKDCYHCEKHIKKAKENLTIGFKIYPVGMIPEKTYKQ